MVYLETKGSSKNNKLFLVKKGSILNKKYKIQLSLGSPSITQTSKEYLLEHLEVFSEKEFLVRKQYLPTNLVHHPSIFEENEHMSIRLNNLREVKSDYGIFLKFFAQEFIFNSNSIEGSRIPSENIREIFQKGSTKYENYNEVREVQNSIQALDYINSDFKFTLTGIRTVYSILTKGLFMSSGTVYPKGFKKIANIVGNSTTVAPEHVKERLQQLLQYYKTNKRTIHPLILAFDFHLEYEHIHPFQDGNGRTGRLLLNKILIDSGYCPMIVFKENSQAYFNALNQAISGNNKKQYYLFMLEQMRKSYKFLLAKV